MGPVLDEFRANHPKTTHLPQPIAPAPVTDRAASPQLPTRRYRPSDEGRLQCDDDSPANHSTATRDKTSASKPPGNHFKYMCCRSLTDAIPRLKKCPSHFRPHHTGSNSNPHATHDDASMAEATSHEFQLEFPFTSARRRLYKEALSHHGRTSDAEVRVLNGANPAPKKKQS